MNKGHRFRTLVWAFAVVGLLAISSVVLADSSGGSDPNDAPDGLIDVKAYAQGHASGGRLFQKIVAFENFSKAEASGLCFVITTFNSDDKAQHHYELCGDGVFRDTDRDYEEVATAKVKRPNEKTIKLIFGKGAIKKPDYFKWYIKSAGACGPEGCDRAPDSGMEKHNI